MPFTAHLAAHAVRHDVNTLTFTFTSLNAHPFTSTCTCRMLSGRPPPEDAGVWAGLSLGRMAPGQQQYYIDTVAAGAEEYDTGGKSHPACVDRRSHTTARPRRHRRHGRPPQAARACRPGRIVAGGSQTGVMTVVPSPEERYPLMVLPPFAALKAARPAPSGAELAIEGLTDEEWDAFLQAITER